MTLRPLPFRVRVLREARPARLRASTRHRFGTVVGFAIVASVLTVVTTAMPGGASNTGSNDSTVQVAPPPVRSITVAPASGTAFSCLDGSDAAHIAFPNGHCFVGSVPAPDTLSGGVTITNGAAPGTILVNGQSAVPADAGTPWALGGSNPPGVDQFFENTFNASLGSLHLSTVAACDTTFDVPPVVGCTAAAGQSANEGLGIVGPSSSTDTNGPFTITTTWTAAP